MRHIVNPRQTKLFDPFGDMLSPLGYRRILQGWQAVFRNVILELMPVNIIAGKFSPNMGTPTKELYSMAGLLLIKEFKNWTTSEAVEAYMFNADVQYALNLEPVGQSMSERTIERYERIFVENELAALTMDKVTMKLVELLNLDVSRQRLDSTHIFSDMAIFGRTRMMGVVIKRFLTQLKRHERDSYELLPETFRSRYAPSKGRLFGEVARNSESRRKLRCEVAEEMHFLIERFPDDESLNGRRTYKDLLRVFGEQCEVVGGKVAVKAHPGNKVMQNPSDPDAGGDGHKGPGYQAQIAQTCSEGNEVQLATAVIPQTADEDDRESMPGVLDKLERSNLLPETLLGDTHYGSDENVQLCAEKGVDLQAPVSGRRSGEDVHKLNIDDFIVDEAGETIERCPAGREPMRSEHDTETGKTRTEMPGSVCGSCTYFEECPVRCVRGRYVLVHTAKERRLAARRREQATDAFKENYKIRGGIESANGGLKRRVGFGRVRTRGSPRVFYKIVMKVCGWNILQAAASATMCRLVAEITTKLGYCNHLRAISLLFGCLKSRISHHGPFSPGYTNPIAESDLHLAA